jgi:integrase
MLSDVGERQQMKQTTQKQPRRKARGAYGNGYVFERHGAWYLQYYQNGARKTVQLAPVDREHNSATCRAIRLLRQKHMMGVTLTPRNTAKDMAVVDFWEHHYLPYCDSEDDTTKLPEKWKGTGMRATTVRGYKQVWEQHLKDHFGKSTLQKYQAELARRFLSSLKTKLGKNTLRHIRALASAMFSEAIERGLRLEANPWHVKLPKDCKESDETKHYTMEEVENLVSALVDHVDAQLVIALCCFLGLGPAEISGLQWGDVDETHIHIRRNDPEHGEVGPPKTKERQRSIMLIDQVRVPLMLWREKTGHKATDPIISDLHNLVGRVIKPHVMGSAFVMKGEPVKCVRCDKVPEASGIMWKGLYSGRRGAITAVIEATGGNYAIAQAMAGHKRMTTTINVYKKAITDKAYDAGMEQYQKALKQ